MIASLIVTVAVTTSPAFNVEFKAPVALLIATLETVGAVVSKVNNRAVLAAEVLPVRSI